MTLHERGGVALDVESQERFGVRGTHVHPPVGVDDRQTVEVIDVGIRVGVFELLEFRAGIFDGAVDLSGASARVDGGNYLADRSGGLAKEFQTRKKGDHPGIGIPVLTKVEVPAVLSAKHDVLFAHNRLYDRVPDLRTNRDAARLDDRLRNTATANEVVK